MESMSLVYFPRRNELSMSEREFLADFNVINKNKIANQKLEAFAVFTLLKMAIGNCSESGFFLEINEKRLRLLANETLYGIDEKFLKRVLQSCFNNGLFDKTLYDKFNILTSLDIQSEYFFSKTVKERIIPNLPKYKDLIYDSIWVNLKNSGKNEENRPKNTKGRTNNKQTKRDETKTETQTKTQTQTESENKISAEALQKFLSQFPNKNFDNTQEVPENIDLDLLAKKIKESDFLMQTKDLTWCIKNCDKVLSGQYVTYNKPKKAEVNYTQRDYSGTDLNKLFDNIKDIELGPPAELGPEEE